MKRNGLTCGVWWQLPRLPAFQFAQCGQVPWPDTYPATLAAPSLVASATQKEHEMKKNKKLTKAIAEAIQEVLESDAGTDYLWSVITDDDEGLPDEEIDADQYDALILAGLKQLVKDWKEGN